MSHRMPLVDGEESILLIHLHWIQFLPIILLFVLSWILYALCGIIAAFVAAQDHTLFIWIVLIGHVFLLLFHHTAFYRYLNVSTQQLLLTNRRIIGSAQRLWVSDDTFDIPLYRIRSIEVKEEGIIQHLLGFGTLILNGGELPSIRHISNPESVHEHIATQVQRLLPQSAKDSLETIAAHSTPFGVS